MAYHKGGPVSTGQSGSWHHDRWLPDIVVIPLEERVMPVTVPHDVVATHQLGCACTACTAYPKPLLGRLRRQMRRVSSATAESS